MRTLVGIFLIALLGFSHVQAKVDPPNYDFSLQELAKLLPGQTLPENASDKITKPEFLKEETDLKMYKMYVSHIRYRFPVFVQVKNKKIVDFYASLPRYFLHDIFHQTLINKIGKQDKFFKVENNSLYIWKNNQGNHHIYSGSCTITCFPIFYTAYNLNEKAGNPTFKPLFEQMNNSPSN